MKRTISQFEANKLYGEELQRMLNRLNEINKAMSANPIEEPEFWQRMMNLAHAVQAEIYWSGK